MSFVITTVSPEAVVQVSDTRLSALSDKSPVSEKQRKSIVVMGKDAHFVFGWIGLAAIGSHNTGDWLYQQLYEMNAVNLPLDRIAGNLTGLATRDFAKLQVTAEDRRCHFVLGGWHKELGAVKAFTCVIYNDLIFHAAKGHNLATLESAPAAASDFLHTIASFQEVKSPYHVSAIGDLRPTTLSGYFSGLKRVMKRRAETATISAACRRIAVEAARHTTTISRNLISVEMCNTGRVRCSYHSEDGTEVMLIPDILSTQGTLLKSTLALTFEGDQMTLKLRGKSVRPNTP